MKDSELTETAKPADDGERTVTATIPQIKSALVRYRALAWITGVWLLILVVEVIAKYGFGVDGFGWVGIAHGWIYVIYLFCTLDLGIKIRWPLGKLVLTALAGTIPFLSFWVEHIRTKEVKARFQLDQ